MNLYNFSYGYIFLAFIALASCGTKSEYHKVVEKELATGERHDSIFLGFHFGMIDKDFFDSCTALNKERKLYQSGRGVNVSFQMELLDQPVEVDFFPNFYQGKIYEMETSYRYVNWAPWWKDLYAEKLKYRLLAIYEKTYGEGFLEIKSTDDKVAYVKVDGNRRISIYQKDDQLVRVIFTDLTKEKLAEKDKSKLANNKQKDEVKPIWFDKVIPKK